MRALPPVVFEHFRRPRNQGRPPTFDAQGQVEGRVDGSWIRVYLRADGERLQASYELSGDRSALAGLSLLSTHVSGRALAEVRALTLEDVALAYGLEEHLLPMLAPAMDALTAALAALLGEPSPFAAEGAVVCKCLHVRRGRILRVIRERGLRTVEEVRTWTRACTGCRSCRPDVEALLREARADG